MNVFHSDPLWLVLVVLAIAPNVVVGQGTDAIQTRAQEFFSGRIAGDPVDSVFSLALSSLEAEKDSLLFAQRPDGSWDDIDYGERPVTNWSITEHYRRLRIIAQYLRSPGTGSPDDSVLVRSISSGLAYAERRIYPGATQDGNWFHWRISAPREMLILLLLTGSASIPDSTRDHALRSVEYLIGNAPQGSGQNLVWEATNQFYLGLLTEDVARIEMARSAMESVCAITTDEGIQPDYSFHQHGAQVTMGSYGSSFVEDVSRFLLLTAGTKYAMSSGAQEVFNRYVLEGLGMTIYRAHLDPSVLGRSISRESRTPITVFRGLVLLSQVSGEYQSRMRGEARDFLQFTELLPSIETAQFIDELLVAAPPSATNRGTTKGFWRSDYVLSRTANSYTSVKMHSKRTINAETLNMEGKKSWHVSDGFTYVSETGKEYYDDNVLAVLDWQRLPGTTVERRQRTAGEGLGYGTKTFVASVADQQFAVAAMDYAPNASTVTAKKSWFMLPKGGLYSLTSSVKSTSIDTVETTIFQHPLASIDDPVFRDGISLPPGEMDSTIRNARTISFGTRSYVLPDSVSVRLLKKVQTGSWFDLASSGSSDIRSHAMVTAYYDHGTMVNNGRAIFAVLPHTSPSEARAFYQNEDVRILRADDSVHAVYHVPSRTLGIVTWYPVRFGEIRTNGKTALILRRTDDDMFVRATAPRGEGGVAEVEIDEKLAPTKTTTGTGFVAQENSSLFRFPAYNPTTNEAVFRILEDWGHNVDLDTTLTEDGLELSRPWPNPVINRSFFTVVCRKTQSVDVRLHDILGREIRTFFSGIMTMGESHLFSIDPKGLSDGTYFLRVRGVDEILTRKLSLFSVRG